MISTYLNLSFDLQERKQKEQQKAQKKKKKDGRPGTSESGCKLSEFPMSSNNPSLPQFVETCVEFIDNEGGYKGKTFKWERFYAEEMFMHSVFCLIVPAVEHDWRSETYFCLSVLNYLKN